MNDRDQDFDQFSLSIADAMLTVVELCNSQGYPPTWRTIYEFLRIAPEYWCDDVDLDQRIVLDPDSDSDLMHAALASRFNTLH